MESSSPSLNGMISPKASLHAQGVKVVQSTPEAQNRIFPKHLGRNGGQMSLNGTPTPSGVYRKPNCSYNCLIGMALKRSGRKCLPVNEIYAFFLNEFPYFRNSAPEGWKNSIRHSLSLGPYFRKAQTAGFQGKKGFQWEVVPDKSSALDQEISKYLAEEGKTPQQFGIESLTTTEFRLCEALTSTKHQLALHLRTPLAKTTPAIESARTGRTTFPTHSICNSIPCLAAIPSPPGSLHCVKRNKSASISKPAKNRLITSHQHPGPTEEEIGGILAYLKDGAPLATPPRFITISNSLSSSPVCEKKSNDTQTTDITHNINSNQPAVVNLSIDDKLAEEVKEFVTSCGCPSLQQGISNSDDLEEWLYLELFDNVNTEEIFGNDVNPERLISDCLDTKQSLNELNCSSGLDHVYKNANFNSHGHRNTSEENTSIFPDNVLLEPVEDWNQWNEPSYVERMISLCNSLNYCRRNTLVDYESNNGGKVKVDFGTETKVRGLNGDNTLKAKKVQVKRLRPAGRVHKRMKNTAKGEKIMSVVADHRRSYACRFAAVQKTPTTGKYSYWKVHRDAATPRSHLKKCCRSLRIRSSEMLQLIVSISFDCLVTERQLNKYHIKI